MSMEIDIVIPTAQRTTIAGRQQVVGLIEYAHLLHYADDPTLSSSVAA